MEKTVILGLGNLLYGDEGFGVRLAQHLYAHWDFPPGVSVVDGGTQGQTLLTFVEEADSLLVLDGQPCTCGRSGCWEAYASATALIRQGKRAAAAQPESLLAGYGEGLTGKDVFDAAAAGDAAAQAVVDRYCVYVAAGITDLVNILGPEKVLIGGGISRQGERLLAPIRAYVAANCFGGHDRTPPVIECARLGNEAGIIGAAAL